MAANTSVLLVYSRMERVILNVENEQELMDYTADQLFQIFKNAQQRQLTIKGTKI